MAEFKHITVLLNEAVDGLNIKPDGTYVDCTLGGGGHRTVAGAQLQGMTIEEAKQAILEHALDALHSVEQEEEQQ